MDCSNPITSDEYMDFIIQNIRRTDELKCYVSVDENWSIVYGKVPPDVNFSVANLDYRTIPKLYGLMDTEVIRQQVTANLSQDLSAYDSAGISAVLNQPSLDVRGQGVIIGVIDTGACVIIMICWKFADIRQSSPYIYLKKKGNVNCKWRNNYKR